MRVYVCGLHSERVSMQANSLHVFSRVSRHIIKGHSHVTREATRQVRKFNHEDRTLDRCYSTAAAAAHAATDTGG